MDDVRNIIKAPKTRHELIYCLLLTMALFYVYNKQVILNFANDDDSTATLFNKLNDNGVANTRNLSNFFLTSDLYTLQVGAGLGNQMYEISSLFGIAAALGMRPFVQMRLQSQITALNKEFPLFKPLLLDDSTTTNIRYFNKCCTYEDIEPLRQALQRNATNVTLNGLYYQTHRYFEQIRPEIQRMFSFSEDTKLEAAKILFGMTEHLPVGAEQMNKHLTNGLMDAILQPGKRSQAESQMRNDNDRADDSVLVCVHIRRGDFVSDSQLLESTEHFTIKAVNAIREELIRNGSKPTFLIIGNDREWSANLFAKDSDVLVPLSPAERAVDLAILVHFCDTIILTASASTFGFWGAYLSDKVTVYYNEKYAKPNMGWYAEQFTPKDVFLSSWTPLRFEEAGPQTAEFSKNSMAPSAEVKRTMLEPGNEKLATFALSQQKILKQKFLESLL